MSNSEVRLLGKLVARSADGVVIGPDSWRTTKTLDLLRILAIARDRPMPVQRITDLLWPEVDRARAGASLRTAASQIRKLLGPESVVRQGEAVALQGVWCDTTAYRAVARDIELSRHEGRHADTTSLVLKSEALYGGDLNVSENSCTWLQDAREELIQLRIRCLLDGAAAAAGRNHLRLSLHLARLAHDLRVTDESTRLLMRGLAGTGEMRQPLEVFEQLRKHLAEDLGVDPAPQTRALYLQIVSGGGDWPPKQLIVGREAPMTQLGQVAARMLGSPAGGGVVYLVGQPGAGRDAVMRGAAHHAGLPFAVHTSGHGPDAELFGAAVVGVPEQHTVTPEFDEHVRRRALRDRLVCAVPVREFREGVGESAIIHVPPLEMEQFVELVRMVLQGPPGDRLVRDLFELSGGLAGLACARMAELLAEDRIVWTAEGLECAGRRTLPEAGGVAQAILTELTPYALDLLLVAAVADGPMCEEGLLRIAGNLAPRDRSCWTVDLESLVDAGLLEPVPGGFRIGAERVRREVLDATRPLRVHRARQQVREHVMDRSRGPHPLAEASALGHRAAFGRVGDEASCCACA